MGALIVLDVSVYVRQRVLVPLLQCESQVSVDDFGTGVW